MARPINTLGAAFYYLHKKGRAEAGRRILQVQGGGLVRAPAPTQPAKVQPGPVPVPPAHAEDHAEPHAPAHPTDAPKPPAEKADAKKK